ncbi:MAG: hypothetical protein BWY66_00576 [bacterium ADurb.Bin374]|nr:MAG: hypothetical protein BWY66_00576 [bacterium ADurb.Bin374]
MTTMTESDRKALRDKIAVRTGAFSTVCGVCKERLTEEDTVKIKAVATELKTLSGQAFTGKRALAGYRLKDMARTLDSILFGRT